MRSPLIWLCLVCSCNPLFGIDQTELWDAAPGSEPPPPPVCPAIGQAPTFGTELYQLAARGVTSLTLDATSAVAAGMVRDPATFVSVPVLGTPGADLASPTLSPPPQSPYMVRVAPEGDALFVSAWFTTAYAIVEYRLVDGVWTAGKPFGPSNASGITVMSAPSRGPNRRFIVPIFDSTTSEYLLVELEYNGETATEISRTPLPAGVSYLEHPNLSPDGLRLVFSATLDTVTMPDGDSDTGSGSDALNAPSEMPLMYADRASLADPFGAPVLLANVPDYVKWPQLTEDCGRLYFFALNTTWYLELLPP